MKAQKEAELAATELACTAARAAWIAEHHWVLRNVRPCPAWAHNGLQVPTTDSARLEALPQHHICEQPLVPTPPPPISPHPAHQSHRGRRVSLGSPDTADSQSDNDNESWSDNDGGSDDDDDDGSKPDHNSASAGRRQKRKITQEAVIAQCQGVEAALRRIPGAERFPKVKHKAGPSVIAAHHVAGQRRRRKKIDPSMRQDWTHEVMGVIQADGLRLMLERCIAEGLIFTDLGAGCNNLCAVAAKLGIETAGIEKNGNYFDIGAKLFDQLGLDRSAMEYGSMFDWRPTQKPGLFFVNNHKFQSLHAALIEAALTFPVGSLLVSLHKLPIGRYARLSKGAGLGASVTNCDGSRTLTYVECVQNGTSVNWGGGAVYDLHFYRVTADGDAPTVFGTTAGYAVAKSVKVLSPQSPRRSPRKHPSTQLRTGATPAAKANSSASAGSTAISSRAQRLAQRKLVQTIRNGDDTGENSDEDTMHGNLHELLLRYIPIGADIDTRESMNDVELTIDPVGPDASTKDATRELLHAVVAVVAPLLRGHYKIQSSLVEPTLLRFLYQRLNDYGSFHDFMREDAEMNGSEDSDGNSHGARYCFKPMPAWKTLHKRCETGSASDRRRARTALEQAEKEGRRYSSDTIDEAKRLIAESIDLVKDMDDIDIETWDWETHPEVTILGYKISVDDLSWDRCLDQKLKLKHQTQNNLNRGRWRQAAAQRAFFADNIADWLELCFVNDAGLERFRRSALEQKLREGKKRLFKARPGNLRGHNIPGHVIPETTASAREEQARTIAKHGVRKCQRLLRSKCDGRVQLVAADQSYDEKLWMDFGLCHDLRSWISLYLLVMHAEGHLKPNLDTGADATGCIGRYTKTILGLWGDSTDGNGKIKHVSQTAAVIIDKDHELIDGGRGLAMMWSIWLDNEDYFSALMETEIAKYELLPADAPAELTRIDFPMWETENGHTHHLWLQMSFRDIILIGDNKFLGEVKGRLGGTARCRGHLVEPMPMQFVDAVNLYEPTTIVDALEWRVEVLHQAAIGLSLQLNRPESNSFYTIDELTKALADLEPAYTAAKKVTKDELMEKLQSVLASKPLTWQDIKLNGLGQLLPNKIRDVYEWSRRNTGQDHFPLGCANNPWATRRIVECIDRLFDGSVAAGCPGFVGTAASKVEYRKLLLTLDDVGTHFNTKGLRSRTIEKAALEVALVDPGTISSTAGVDLHRWLSSRSVDHDRKGLMDDIITITKSTARPDACQHEWAGESGMEQRFNEATGVDGENFCSGARKDNITHASETWEPCCQLLQLIAEIADRAGLGNKLSAAPMRMQDWSPELNCRIGADETGQVYVVPNDHKLNHRIEIALTHYLELVLHRLLRIVTKVTKTNNLYRMGAQWAPFMNTQLRKQGLSSAYTSDFQFEVLFRSPKQYVSRHDGRWTPRVLRRLTRNQVQRLLRRGKGWLEARKTGRPARSERPFSRGIIVAPCVRFHHSGSSKRRRMVWGADGFETEDEDNTRGPAKRTRSQRTAQAPEVMCSESEDEEEADRKNLNQVPDSDSDEEGAAVNDRQTWSDDEGDDEDEDDDDDDDDELFLPFEDEMWVWSSERYYKTRVNADATKLGKRNIPADPDSMFQADRKCRQRDISGEDGLAAPYYLHKRAGCDLVGETAIAAYVFDEIWGKWGHNEAGDGGSVEQVCKEPHWPADHKSRLRNGDYYVTIGGEHFVAKVFTEFGYAQPLRICCERVTVQELQSEVRRGFHVELDADAWTRFMSRNSAERQVQALAQAKVNGTRALLVDCCDYAPYAKCPFCPTASSGGSTGGTGTDGSTGLMAGTEGFPKLHSAIMKRDAAGSACQCNRKRGCRCTQVPHAITSTGRDDPLSRDEEWSTARLPLAAMTMEGAVDYILACVLREADSKKDFEPAAVRALSGEAVFELLLSNLGPKWTHTYVGASSAAMAASRISTFTLTVLRRRFNKPSNRLKSLCGLVYDQWAEWKRHPRFFRGQRVLARSQHRERAEANDEYDGWFAGRIIGVGRVPNSYEILFDELNEDGDEDRHYQTFPFLDSKNDKAFLMGKRLGNHPNPMIKVPVGDMEWDSVISV